MIQITLPVIIISLQKHCEQGVHQHPGHNRHAQADCLSTSDLLRATLLFMHGAHHSYARLLWSINK